MKRSNVLRAGVAVLAWWGCAAAQAAPGEWQQTFVFYGMGAAIDGTTEAGDLSVPVDVGISDVFDALEFGAMGAWRIENDEWSYTVDATFMGLGGHSRTEGGRVKGDVDIDQFTLMGTVGRRFSERFEGLFSLSYFDLSADLVVSTTAPVTGEVTRRKAGTDADWIDPMVGVQYRMPLSDQWNLGLRGDIGGFGIGSDLSYQALATVHWQANDRLGVVMGYRLIGFDYEDGDEGDRGYQRFDLTEQGPLVGVTCRF